MLCLAKASYILQGTSVAVVSAFHIIMSAIRTSTTTAVRTRTGRVRETCESTPPREAVA